MRMLKTFALSLLLLATTGHANYYGECDPCCCGNFEVSAEWLYFMSAIDQPYYALKDLDDTDEDFIGPRVANDQDWHSGYRLEAAYYLPNCTDHIRARWTHFNNFTDSDRVFTGENGELFPILSIPNEDFQTDDFAAIRDEFDFYTLEFLFGRPIYHCQGLQITIEAGIQFTRLDLDEKVLYVDDEDNFILDKNRSKLWGVGPELSLSFDYCLNRCFSIVGRSTSAILAAKKETSFFETSFDGGNQQDIFKFKDDDYYIGVPTIDGRLGLAFDWSFDSCWCGCVDLTFEAGYEFIHIFKGVSRIYFTDDGTPGQSIDQYMDFTLHGPYLRVGVGF